MLALDDIASDLSAVHRVWIEPEVGDYGRLSGPAFFRLVERLHHHRGSVREFWAEAVARSKRKPDELDGGSAAALVAAEDLGDVVQVG